MPVVRFGFDHPSESGEDAPAVGRVECQLLTAEAGHGGRVRSTRAFSVWLSDGEGTAFLSPTGLDQAWHVRVVGVPGFAEAWVDVPDVDGEVSFNDLPRVDPSSVPIGPATLRRWAQALERAEHAEEVAAGTTAIAAQATTTAGEARTRALDAVDKANAATTAVNQAVQNAAIAAGEAVYGALPAAIAEGIGISEPAREIYYPGPLAVRAGAAGISWSRDVGWRGISMTMSSPPRGATPRIAIMRDGVQLTAFNFPVGQRTFSNFWSAPFLNIVRGSIITVDVLTIGTTDPGADLVVTLFVAPGA